MYNKIMDSILNKKEESLINIATVVTVNPLTIKFPPDTTAIPAVILTNLFGIAVNSRVLTLRYGKQFIVTGVIGNYAYPIGWTFYQRKTSDTSRTSTTASDDPHLTITLPANGVYNVETEFVIDGDDSTTDIKISWTNSNINELTRRSITAIGPNATSSVNSDAYYSNNYAFATEIETGVVTAGWTCRREHFVISTDDDDGTITPKWGCVNSSGTVTLKSFSFVIVTKVDNN